MAFDYEFKNQALLNEALTHRSYANEVPGAPDNERLEFLGDAFTNLVVSRLLFDAHPKASEGQLSKMRANLVSAEALAVRARALGLGARLRMGQGERRSGGAEKSSLLADAFEALVAAIYLDGGAEAARLWVEKIFAPDIANAETLARDVKTELQEHFQRVLKLVPRYEIAGEHGLDHERVFRCLVLVGDHQVGAGEGRSKKAAERAAAENALQLLELQAKPRERK